MFLEKHGSLDLYDEDLDKRSIIDHEQLEFNINSGLNLIVITEKPDGILSDYDYFGIHGDLFNIIQSTHQDRNIMWNFIPKEPNENDYQSEATEIHDDKIQHKKMSTTKKLTKHKLQRNRQKLVEYRDK